VKVVLASGNPGKVREIQAIAGPGLELVLQSSLDITEAAEPHSTFVENALAKARHASRASHLPALADDSGLCVDALGGEPGVRSAYYAGHTGSRDERDVRNNARLLAELKDDRRAYYCCVMVLVRHPDDPRPLIAEGLWQGEIARSARGTNGFGYDPLFLVPALGKTAAELAADEKNRLSHRAAALRKLLGLLDAADRR
jgi:XTP/dITP diphosphohydrolase